MLPSELTEGQFTAFTTVERVCSTLSLAGCAFIATTFLSSKHFHKPINRLVFYASLGNIFTNVATIISRSALDNASGPLCQFQSFLIQMFMPADAYWTLAMACNVFLTFYYKFDAEQLRRLEVYYLICCYGVPFIPAFVYIFAKAEGKGHIYGNATLWCWVDSEWDYLRIATFYGPVWVVMILTNAIYLRAGREIYAKRKSLQNFRGPAPDPLPIIGDPFQSVKTTEVFVTSEQADISPADSIDLRELGPQGGSFPRPPQATKNAYTVTVSSSQKTAEFQPPQPGPTRYSYAEKPIDRQISESESMDSPTAPMSAQMPNSERSNLYPARRHAAKQADNAAWSYTKVAILFFVAMMVTWIPSSANRVYSVVHPGKISLGLEFASAFVLPLQGFWNALIYAMTSWRACKAFWRDLTSRKRLSGSGIKQMNIFTENRDNHRNNKMYIETDSMTELAGRPSTKGSSR